MRLKNLIFKPFTLIVLCFTLLLSFTACKEESGKSKTIYPDVSMNENITSYWDNPVSTPDDLYVPSVDSDTPGEEPSFGDDDVSSDIVDTDNDGVTNNKDDDIDGDGIPNVEDEDMDGDKKPNVDDDDIDGDDVSNESDSTPEGSTPGTETESRPDDSSTPSTSSKHEGPLVPRQKF